MGAFFLIKKQPPVESRAKILDEQFQRQGFSSPAILSTPDYDLYLYCKLVSGESQIYRSDNEQFCVATGSFIYDGKMGHEALQSLYENFDADNVNYDKLYGAFCFIIRKAGKTFIFTDRIGVYKVFTNTTQTVISTSFIALANIEKNKKINSQCVYEYIFQGATYGHETLFNAITHLKSDRVYKIAVNTTHTITPPLFSESFSSYENINHLLDISLIKLRKYYKDIAGNFGNSIDTALSGGYDSRLTLALLLEQGIDPAVHVYGKNSDADVIVAKNIDAHENLGLKHVDKSEFAKTDINVFEAAVRNNYYAFDGFPTDGIIGGAADLQTRQERCQNGVLMLNGGGGEIFRNFFYLPNKRYHIHQLLWTFYAQFDPGNCRVDFDETHYFYNLALKVKQILGIEREILTRREIEMLYVVFRCRFWMGKNNSINNRLGFMLTPFIDYDIVRTAIDIPIKYKNHGIFEAQLINMVNPKLAAYQSDYGHNFIESPTMKHKLKDWATLFRPTLLRRYSYRIQSRRRVLNRDNYFAEEYLQQVLHTDFPIMNHYFDVGSITDGAQFNRICTLEYLFEELGAVH